MTQDSIVESEPLDVTIVGAGPCGLATAIAVKKRGLSYVILDRGCVTEALTHYPSYMTFFSTAERLEIGDVPFTIPDPKPTPPRRARLLPACRRPPRAGSPPVRGGDAD